MQESKSKDYDPLVLSKESNLIQTTVQEEMQT